MTNKMDNPKLIDLQMHQLEVDALIFALQPAMDEIQTKGKSILFPAHLQYEFRMALFSAVQKLCNATISNKQNI